MRYPRFALVAVLALVSVPTAWGRPQAELVLQFVEIGQGDCKVAGCPNGGFILVDAGSSAHGDRDAVRKTRNIKEVTTRAIDGCSLTSSSKAESRTVG